MISINLQLLLIVLNLGLAFFLVNNIRKYKLELRYSLLWIFLSLVSLLLATFPRLLFFISDSMYIETPVNALYLVAFILVFIILYFLTVTISKLSNQNKKLTQEVGLLKNEIYQIKYMSSNIEHGNNNI